MVGRWARYGLVACYAAGVLQSCAPRSFVNDVFPVTMAQPRACCTPAEGAPAQVELAKAAADFLGHAPITVGNRRFSSDCSGLVRGIYATQQVELYEGLGELDGGNGVGRIYTHVVEHGRIHQGPTVHPGDLVFFHNTWDFNRDGRFNDPLTHVGVVEQVERDGTVVFVSRVSAGTERYRMNLREPNTHKTDDGRVLNDYMRRRASGDPSEAQYLTGQLFAAFGTVVGEGRAMASR
jgi:hypothetical protein